MGSIYWRNGWAYGRKRIKGQEYRGPLGTRSERLAQAAFKKWLTDLEDRIRAGVESTSGAVTWQEAVDNFRTHHFPTLKPASRKRYLQSILNLTPHFRNRQIHEIGKKAIGEFVTARRHAGKLSEHPGENTAISDSTIIRDLQCLSSIFTIANDFDLCETNPANAYIKAHQHRGTLVNSDPRTRYLSHIEEETVLQAAYERSTVDGAIRRFEKFMICCAIALYVDTGFRRKELLAAQRSWVDFNRNEITVPAGFTKSEKSRTIPLLPRARRIIEMIPENKQSDQLLWRTAIGRPFADLNKTLQGIAGGVGVHNVEVHDLRRTCGCRLLQDHRMKMAEVSTWLGHASVEMTEKVYAFLKTENLHDAIGGRVRENAARERLALMLDAECLHLVGTKAGTKELKAFESSQEKAKKLLTHNP